MRVSRAQHTSRVGDLLKSLSIPSPPDVFQNIGKNTANLVRGSFKEWDRSLKALSAAERPAVEAVFNYAAARIARTAKFVKTWPEIDAGKLTFGAVVSFFEALREEGSGGAYEQFIVAAVLHGSYSEGQKQDRYVETKNLNASDASARVAADVQIKTGARVLDAFEVTANNWDEKLDGAAKTVLHHDLPRLNIIGRLPENEYPKMLEMVGAQSLDLAVQDLRSFYAATVAQMVRSQRAEALRRLYDLLVRRQPVAERVNRYVDLLVSRGLTV